jgi:hypothetical protein
LQRGWKHIHSLVCLLQWKLITCKKGQLWGLSAKFVDSSCYSKSEVRGCAVMVSFWSTSLGKWCTSDNVPPTFRKRAADCWSLQNFLPQSSLFMVGKSPEIARGKNHEKGALRQEILKWSTVCNTFSRSGHSVVRGASLAKGGTLKKRLSPCLQKVLTRSNKVSSQTLRTAHVFCSNVLVSENREFSKWVTVLNEDNSFKMAHVTSSMKAKYRDVIGNM